MSDLFFENIFSGDCVKCLAYSYRSTFVPCATATALVEEQKEVKVKEIKEKVSGLMPMIVVTLFYLDLPYCYLVFLLLLLPSFSFAIVC